MEIMTEYPCEYCGTVFADKSNMVRHQKKAKYCLELQGRNREGYKCPCGKSYSRNDNLQRHQGQCKIYQQYPEKSSQDVLLEIVKTLQSQMTLLATKNPRTVIMNNLPPITDQDLYEHLEHLTLDIIKAGAKGYADFAGTYPLKNKVICTDRARKKLKYRDETGQLTDDSKTLARRFFQAISARNAEILNEAYSTLHQELQDTISNDRAGDADITSILLKATSLQDILIKSQQAAYGKDDEFAQEFISHLSKMVP